MERKYVLHDFTVHGGIHTEIADHLYAWPNFADGDLYKDYGEHKRIPVMFTGSLAPHYPWRNRVYRRVSPFYPSLVSPHFGWGGDWETRRTVFGEQYARLLNASYVVPSCGTIANELVRKHLEIPASRACLLAPRTPALEAAGFRSMHNCVFVDEHDVLDVLDYLFAHPAELQSITDEGYQLVRSKHLPANRDQIYQWFRLGQDLAADQKIVQLGPFDPLITVPKDSPVKNTHLAVNGLDRQLLQLGDKKLHEGKYTEAKELFLRCLNYHAMAEPCLRLAMTSLLEGDAEAARRWCSRQVKVSLEQYNDYTPDPVEWAYSIVIELCRGRESSALDRAAMFHGLRHPELDRARIVAAIAAGRDPDGASESGDSGLHYSVHELCETSFHNWIRTLCRMLNACGRRSIAERVASSEEILSSARPCADQPSNGRRGPVAIDANTISDKTLLPHRMRASLLPARAYGRRWGSDYYMQRSGRSGTSYRIACRVYGMRISIATSKKHAKRKTLMRYEYSAPAWRATLRTHACWARV